MRSVVPDVDAVGRDPHAVAADAADAPLASLDPMPAA